MSNKCIMSRHKRSLCKHLFQHGQLWVLWPLELWVPWPRGHGTQEKYFETLKWCSIGNVGPLLRRTRYFFEFIWFGSNPARWERDNWCYRGRLHMSFAWLSPRKVDLASLLLEPSRDIGLVIPRNHSLKWSSWNQQSGEINSTSPRNQRALSRQVKLWKFA